LPSSGLNLVDWGGTGKPVLLVHGMGANTHWWDPVIKHLKGLRPAALDLSGHGDSDWADAYTTEGWVADIDAAADRLGWERFTLVGHSLGGRLALEYAKLRKERLEKVAAVDFLPESRRASASRVRQPRYATDAEILGRFHLQPPGTLLSAEELLALARYCVRKTPEGWTWKFDWRAFRYRYPPVWDMLAYVRVPALIVRGEDSTILGRAQLERMIAELPEGRAAEVSGAWHHVPLDAPAPLAAVLSEFVCA
jgi:pimeloyl-ACP methyl ester carboxylesterase